MYRPVLPIVREKTLFIFDLDGVIYRANDPIPSAIAAIQRLQQLGKKIAFFTNNSSQTPSSYQFKLKKMGISIPSSTIFTSALISARYLAKRFPHGAIFYIGEEGLVEALKDQGLYIVNQEHPNLIFQNYLPSDIHVDAVIVGWDREVTYAKFRMAYMCILAGAEFYATNNDPTYPAPGTLWPGAGANVAFLAVALDRPPMKIFGKPSPDGLLEILETYHYSLADAVMIGDRLSTDILSGNRAGITTIAVETGVHTRRNLPDFPPSHHPTIFLTTLDDLFKTDG